MTVLYGLGNSEGIEWHDWAGGSCPFAPVPIAVRWRNGNEWQGNATDFQWHWASEPRAFDIVAYALLPIDDPNLASDDKIGVDMERPSDLPEPVWERAIDLVDLLTPEEGWTHHSYWDHVEKAARTLWDERQHCAEIARTFYGGNAIAKAILFEGNWDAYGWAPAKQPEPSGLRNAWNPKTGRTE